MHHPLRIARKARKMTLDELAAASGVGASTIGNIETGRAKPSEEMLQRLAKALRMQIDEIRAPEGFGLVLKESATPYGSPLRYLTAEALAENARRLLGDIKLPLPERGRAAKDFVDELAQRKEP